MLYVCSSSRRGIAKTIAEVLQHFSRQVLLSLLQYFLPVLLTTMPETYVVDSVLFFVSARLQNRPS